MKSCTHTNHLKKSEKANNPDRRVKASQNSKNEGHTTPHHTVITFHLTGNSIWHVEQHSRHYDEKDSNIYKTCAMAALYDQY
jgi:hypothetical protein